MLPAACRAYLENYFAISHTHLYCITITGRASNAYKLHQPAFSSRVLDNVHHDGQAPCLIPSWMSLKLYLSLEHAPNAENICSVASQEDQAYSIIHRACNSILHDDVRLLLLTHFLLSLKSEAICSCLQSISALGKDLWICQQGAADTSAGTAALAPCLQSSTLGPQNNFWKRMLCSSLAISDDWLHMQTMIRPSQQEIEHSVHACFCWRCLSIDDAVSWGFLPFPTCV